MPKSMSRITRAYCLFLSRLALGKIAELRATETPPQSVGLPHDKICQLIVSERTGKPIDAKTLRVAFRAELDRGVAVAYAALANAIALHDKQWVARDTRETILRCSAVGSHSGVPPLWPFWLTRFCSAARAPNPATLHSVLRPSVAWSCVEP
jgi:hypothetical protein